MVLVLGPGRSHHGAGSHLTVRRRAAEAHDIRAGARQPTLCLANRRPRSPWSHCPVVKWDLCLGGECRLVADGFAQKQAERSRTREWPGDENGIAGGGDSARQFVLYCPSNPCRYGAVIVLGGLANTLKQLGWKTHGYGNGHASASADRRPLWFLVFGSCVELMFLIGGHVSVGHRSFLYWSARCWEAT